MYDSLATNVWFNQTTLHPIGVMALLMLGAATLVVPRRYALVPMLILVCFVAPAQRFVIATLDFNFLRIMILVGWLRIIFRNEATHWRWKPIDTVMLAWALCATVVAMHLQTTFAAIVTRLGLLYDAVGLYFLCRILVRNWRDLYTFARAAAVVSIPVAMAFLIEKTTGRNWFSIFGGVSEYTTIRAGRLRCQGPFTHPILAGCFWAALSPLIGALWFRGGRDRVLAAAGVTCSLVVVFTCASATPVGGLIAGLFAAALFPLRRFMSWIRLAVVLGAVVLQLLMSNPIWHLMARMNFVSGSTGWYRFKLIDEFIRHFGDWWLVGTNSYVNWWSGRFEAITNEYVLQGLQGGLITLALYILIIALAFRGVGQIERRTCPGRRRAARMIASSAPPRTPRARRAPREGAPSPMVWALGVALLIQCVAFTAVSCFGQAVLVWYVTIGCIGSLIPVTRRRRLILRKPRPAPRAPAIPPARAYPSAPVAGA
jgi:hypothetical protein